MKEYTMLDLFRLTRAELLKLDHEMALALMHLPNLSEDLTIALINQRRIRRELACRELVHELGPR